MGRKFKFFLSFLLILLFAISLNNFCFASADISKAYIDYSLDILKSGDIISENTYISNFDSKKVYDGLINIMSSDNLNINDYNLTIFSPYQIRSNSINKTTSLVFIISNNGASNTLPFLEFGISKNYPYNLIINKDVFVYIMLNNNQYTFLKASDGVNDLNIQIYNDSFKNKNLLSFNNELTVCTQNIFINKNKIGSAYIYYPNYEDNNLIEMNIVNNATTFYQWAGIDEPTESPSGDTSGDIGGSTGNITNPSGETTGKVDLSGIEQGIGDINQNIDKTNEKLDGISGEVGKLNENLTSVPSLSGEIISSGEITNALNFDFAKDPYSNFWLEFTTGLSNALTGNNRSIKIDFRNKSYNINLDDFSLQVPDFLKSFLAIISTVLVVWQMIKYVKIIIDKISSGNMDEVLAMNEEERNS